MNTPLRAPLGLVALGAAFLTMGCDPSVLGQKSQAQGQAPPAAAPALVANRPAPQATRAPRPTAGAFDPGDDGRLSLREFYQQKYPDSERNAVRSTLQQVVPGMDAAELDEATAEILAYHHVVYHRTRLHDLEKNHAVLRRIEPKLREAAAKFDVPVLPLLAIVSWENSGDLTQISWANAAGLGQMTWGAVERAHSFAGEEAARLNAEADVARSTGDATRAAELEAKARNYDVASRHKKLQQTMKIQDERMIVEANLEDAALFFKYLLQCYGDRPDLAISAYHNGVLNNDDILYDYLLRQGEYLSYPGEDRSEFLQALARRNLTYLDVWRDVKSRQMLNGLRTVEGEVTTAANADMALGDESDIYPWKVLASLAAFQAGPEHTAATVARYGDRWDVVEVKGLPEHANFVAFAKAIEDDHLVKTSAPLNDLGIGGRSPAGTRGRDYSYYVTPELDGYLSDLTKRLREVTGKPDLKVPVSNLSAASGLGSKSPACPGGESGTHLRGVAVDIVPGALEPAQQKALEALLWSDYLMDRVFLSRHAGAHHVVLNPRRGDDYMQAGVKRHAD